MRPRAANETIFIVSVPNGAGKTAFEMESPRDQTDAIVPTRSRLWRKQSYRVRLFSGVCRPGHGHCPHRPTKAVYGTAIAVFEDGRVVEGGERI